jgi:adenosylhomocysteine nucleosidase
MIITKAIITAMPDEAELIIKKYSLKEVKILWALTIYEWEILSEDNENEKLVLLLCGVGKIHSAFATTYLFENYDPYKVINIWVVGNLNPWNIKIGDVVIPNTFVQHDVYIPEAIDSLKYLRDPIFTQYAIGEEYNLEKFSLHLNGICVTGDQFIDNEDLKAELVEEHSADIVDMEAYSILSVAKNYDALDKMVVIKSVSDGADNEAADAHVGNLDAAMQNAVVILEFVL